VGFAALIVMVLHAPAGSRSGRFFRLAPLRACGRYSYAMYVVHPALLVLLKRGWLERTGLFERLGYTLAQPLVIVAGGLATFAVAYASWHLYERHFLRLRDRIAPRAHPSLPANHPGREAHA
jgi:peptidoglycan/LPS O-acetylase OafA/YrhL